MNSDKRWLFIHDLQGYVAMWAIRQSPYKDPDGLSDVIRLFRIRAIPEFDKAGMAKLSRAEVDDILTRCLISIPQVQQWNERKNGNKSPMGFCSRYDKPHPDDDFIDLGALIRNIRISLFQELDRDYELDQRIERDWSRGWMKRFLLGIRYKLFPLKARNPTSALPSAMGVKETRMPDVP